MGTLSEIPIQVESGQGESGLTENAVPVLHEVRHALERFLESGESTVIDLNSMPFAPGDEERLMTVLGRGEVNAEINALGLSKVWETGYAGVWVVDHMNVEGERVALFIEVTDMPSILCAQPEDVEAGLGRLQQALGRG